MRLNSPPEWDGPEEPMVGTQCNHAKTPEENQKCWDDFYASMGVEPEPVSDSDSEEPAPEPGSGEPEEPMVGTQCNHAVTPEEN